MMKKLFTVLVITFMAGGMAIAAEKKTQASGHMMDHSGHNMDHSGHDMTYKGAKGQASGTLKKLDAVPTSGKAREAGFDDKYPMETTSAKDSLAEKCAKGSRGLIMLDNKTWEKCGGKPQGIPSDSAATNMPANQSGDHSGHTGH